MSLNYKSPTLSHPRANLGGKGLWRSPEGWECPQQALIGRLVLMKFLKWIYLHPSPLPWPGCVFPAIFGRFPMEYSLWEREFWLQKSRVRSGSASSVPSPWLSSTNPAVTQLPGFHQQLNQMMEASKCIFFGKLGWISDPGPSRSCCSNSSGIALSCRGFECPAEPSKSNFHPFPFF